MNSRLPLVLALLPAAAGFGIPPSSPAGWCLPPAAMASTEQQPSDMFIEEMFWAKEGDLQVKPDSDWVAKEFHSQDIIRENHEWFSEATVIKHSNAARSHDWFTDAMSDQKVSLPQQPKAMRREETNEWFSQAIPATAVSRPVSSKAEIQDDHQTETFSFAMMNQPPVSLPQNIRNVSTDSRASWFSTTTVNLPSKNLVGPAPFSAQRADWFANAVLDETNQQIRA